MSTDDTMAEVYQPLNRQLYNNLRSRFGSVQIANPSVPMIAATLPGAISGRPHHSIVTAGETYRINCPICGDSRHRLWIGYLYGQPVQGQPGRVENWLIHCFNEECEQKPGRRSDLEQRILGFRNFQERQQAAPIAIGNYERAASLSVCRPPGMVAKLSQLPPTHEARTWLMQDRRFHPDWVAEKYNVGFCLQAEPEFRLAGSRIILPIYMHQQFVGWQARSVGPPAYGPKYWNLPNMPKTAMLYNFDVARNWPFVVVVEGATKVWRVGDPAVAVFGKTVGFQQRVLLEEHWAGKPVILLLDGNAHDEMEGIVREMQRADRVQLVPIYMPPGMPEPDECEHEYIVAYIRQEALKVGVFLPEW